MVFLLSAFILTQAKPAQAFGGGTGTHADPYQITTCQELQDITKDVAASYKLNNNIDCSNTSSFNGGHGFVPIGATLDNNEALGGFGGTLDGQGYAIDGLHLTNQDDASFVGLFRNIKYGVIRNLKITNQVITTDIEVSGKVGGLAAAALRADIAGVSVEADLTVAGQGHAVGGLVGSMDVGRIANSHAIVTMTMTDGSSQTQDASHVGGLSGDIQSSVITNSYASGSLNRIGATGSAKMGGFGGVLTSAPDITNSFAQVAIAAGNNDSAGGFAGTADQDFPQVYFDATLADTADCVGDDAQYTCTAVNTNGLNPDYFNNNTTNPPLDDWDFSNIWQLNVSAPTLRTTHIALPGALAAPTNVSAQAYSPTTISVSWTPPAGAPSRYNIQHKLDSSDTWLDSSQINPPATTTLLVSLTPGQTYDVRVVAEKDNDSQGTTVQGDISSVVTVTTPTTPLLSGEGTITDPYQISSCQDLQDMGEMIELTDDDIAENASYILTQDIDCSDSINFNDGIGFMPISSLYGVLDGQGHSISGLYINGNLLNQHGFQPDAMLIKYLEGTVRNLRLLDETIVGADQQFALGSGLIGSASPNSLILSVHVDLSLTGPNTGNWGGLVQNFQGTISKSSVSGSMTLTDTADDENSRAGGLVASSTMNSQISNSYSTLAMLITTDPVPGHYYSVGGLVGISEGNVSNSYSSGPITITGSIRSLGGIFGLDSNPNGVIENSFTASPISVSGDCTDCGAVVGLVSTDKDFSTTYYDQTAVGFDRCMSEHYADVDCQAVNVGNTQPNYFKNNHTNAPLGTWNFDSIWQTTNALPIHKVYENSNPNPPTDLVATSAGNTINVTWDAPLNTGNSPIQQYIIQYRTTPNGAWRNIETGTDDTEYTIQNLGTATQYAIRVFAQNQDGFLSQPTNTVFATTNLDGYTPITDCQGLQDIDNDLEANYYLTHDIDCSASSSWNSGAGFKPIGSDPLAFFTGNLAGNGYTIKGLYIDTTNLGLSVDTPIGIFVGTDGAALENLRITGATIKTSSSAMGTLTGLVLGSAVNNVQVESTTLENTLADGIIGGLIGSAGSDDEAITAISQSSFTGTITATVADGQEFTAVGGLLGAYSGHGIANVSAIKNSYANATINIITENTPYVAAGGLLGYLDGTASQTVPHISNSYAIGSITITGDPQTVTVAGGIAGISGGGRIDHVFSAVTMPTSTQDFISGGIIGTAQDGPYPTNSYYDAWRGNTTSCLGVNNGGMTGNDATCIAVNQSGSQPNYFKTNKTNPPLDAWDFADIWFVTTAYPDFQGNGALTPAAPEFSITPTTPTTEPTNPGEGTPEAAAPGTDETVAVTSETNKPGTTTDKKEEAQVVEPGILGAIKNFVRSLPKGVVESFPYLLFGLLILAAIICLIALWRELRRLHALQLLLAKQRALAEERDTFWHLAANYLRAPVTLIVGGAEALSTAGATSTTMTITQAARNLQTKIAGIMSKIEASKTLQEMGKTGNVARIHTLRRVFFFMPVIVVGVLALMANYAAASYRSLSPGALGYISQVAIFVIVSIIFYWTLDLLTRGRQKRRAAQRRLDLQAEQLSTARTALIQDTATMLGDDLTKLEKALPTVSATTAGVATLKEGTSRLRQIVTSFGMLVRLQGSQGVANAADLPSNSVDELLGSAVAQLTAQARAKNIRIIMPTQTGLTISGEPDLAAQAVYSILANAIEFTPAGGTVTIKVGKTVDGVQLRIADQGPGIDAEQLPHLFQPFIRTDGKSALDLSHQGFGINLYIDKLIMEHVGGSIKAASTPGKGTNITMNWH